MVLISFFLLFCHHKIKNFLFSIFHFLWSPWHLVGQAEDVKGERGTEESQEVRDLVEVQHPLWSCVWVLGTFVIIFEKETIVHARFRISVLIH